MTGIPSLDGSNINNSSNFSSVSYSLYYSNGSKINIDQCKYSKTSIEVYVGNNKFINESNLGRNLFFDIFNPKSPYFNDRCIPLKINDTEFTINERRKKFSGYEIHCSIGCIYLGVNASTLYTKCSCNTTRNELIANITATILNAITSSNLNIILCISIFEKSLLNFFKNPGFLIYLSFFLCMFIGLKIYNMLNSDIMFNSSKIEKFIENDATFYHTKIEVKEFFNRCQFEKENINIKQNEGETERSLISNNFPKNLVIYPMNVGFPKNNNSNRKKECKSIDNYSQLNKSINKECNLKISPNSNPNYNTDKRIIKKQPCLSHKDNKSQSDLKRMRG